jgi:hypothetical protein
MCVEGSNQVSWRCVGRLVDSNGATLAADLQMACTLIPIADHCDGLACQIFKEDTIMSTGAFALYIDLSAGSGGGGGGGNSATILRAVPLPHLSGEVHVQSRRLTLAYDTRGLGPDPLSVEFRFFDDNHTVTADGSMLVSDGCNDLTVPGDACMVSFRVLPLSPPGPRGALTAMVEYSD